MPIYAYRCDSCGHQQDSLQKLADPHLIDCPACKQPALKRQLTAAGFQLKGTGWYVTDFRDGGKKPSTSTAPAVTADQAGGNAAPAPAADKSGPPGSTPASAPASTPNTSAPSKSAPNTGAASTGAANTGAANTGAAPKSSDPKSSSS